MQTRVLGDQVACLQQCVLASCGRNSLFHEARVGAQEGRVHYWQMPSATSGSAGEAGEAGWG